jgi:hypothetical protein
VGGPYTIPVNIYNKKKRLIKLDLNFIKRGSGVDQNLNF